MAAADPDSQAKISALNRARDIDAQESQGFERLVKSADGNVYLCMAGIADESADLEPVPKREHPNSMIDFAAPAAVEQRHAILRRLDLMQTANPMQLVFFFGDDGKMQAAEMPGVLAGLEARHPFQVIYAGDDNWLVGAGPLTVEGGTDYSIEAKLLNTQEGWICLNTSWTVSDSENGYLCTAAELVTVSNLNNVDPPEWKMSGAPNYTLSVGDGTLLLPIAFVARTPGKRPLIQQTQTTGFHFHPAGWPWGRIGPPALSF